MNDRTTKCETLLRAGAIAAALFVATSAGAATPTDVWIRATSTSSFSNGTTGLYTVTVSNRGAAVTDADIHVTDVLPDGFRFFSGTGRGWQCSAAGQTVDCVRSGALRAGSASSVRLKVTVCTTATELTNSIHVVYPADTNSANNTVTRTTGIRPGRPCLVSTATPTVVGSGPTATETAVTTGTPTPTPIATSSTPAASTDLQMDQTISPFRTGSNGVYTLTVTNVGAATTNAPITVTDLLPDSLPFVSAAGTGWICSHAGQAVTCTTADPLAPTAGTSITLTVFVSAAAYPTVTNTATLAYDGDTNVANDVAHRPTTIRQGGSAAASTRFTLVVSVGDAAYPPVTDIATLTSAGDTLV